MDVVESEISRCILDLVVESMISKCNLGLVVESMISRSNIDLVVESTISRCDPGLVVESTMSRCNLDFVVESTISRCNPDLVADSKISSCNAGPFEATDRNGLICFPLACGTCKPSNTSLKNLILVPSPWIPRDFLSESRMCRGGGAEGMCQVSVVDG